MNTGIRYMKKDLLQTIKGSPDYCAKYCNAMANCKMFVYDQDNSNIGRLLSNGETVVNTLQTTFYK